MNKKVKKIDKIQASRLKDARKNLDRLSDNIKPFTKPKVFTVVSSEKRWEGEYGSHTY